MGAANCARRSPWPMINILRTPQVRAAQKGVPTGIVYKQNEERLNEIGTTSTDRVLQIPTGDYNSFQIYIRVGIPMILRCAFSYLSFVEALGP